MYLSRVGKIIYIYTYYVCLCRYVFVYNMYVSVYTGVYMYLFSLCGLLFTSLLVSVLYHNYIIEM